MSSPRAPDDLDSYAERARVRSATWQIAKPGVEPVAMDTASVVARLAQMEELARLGWALSGRPFPDYTRAAMPGTLLWRGGAR